MSEIRENAYESWPLYDTVNIGLGQRTLHPTWFNTFVQLGNETKIPFFNQRNRSSVGEMYNNFDSSEQISYAYMAYSMGIEMYVPVYGETEISENAGVLTYTPSENVNPQLFMDFINHISLRFQVGQDEKLLINGAGAPAGAGATGFFTSNNISNRPDFYNTVQILNNGTALLKNRWFFAEPVEIPRNRNIAAWIEFSPYAKNMLQGMPGPFYTTFREITASSVETVSSIGACYQMRLSMFGKREVQQRNALAFQ